MSKPPLVIHVDEPETGAKWDYVFEAGPVILGRGDDAQLQIARPFVSLHHGTFDFDDTGVTYVDLESRNGTLVDGVARGSDRPVPVTEASDIRIGKVRLRVSRSAPAAGVGEDRPNPFAPRKQAPGAPVKGTDALPREDVERIRREILARKVEPPAPAPPVVAPFAAPTLEKTVPVPVLQSRPTMVPPPAPRPPTPVTPYAVGGTAAVPLPPREEPVRRTTRSRPTSSGTSVRRPTIRTVTPRPWWPYVLMAAVFVVGLAALAIVVGSAEEEDEVVRRRPRPETTSTFAPPPPVEPVKEKAPVEVEPVREPILEEPAPKKEPPAIQPERQTPVKPPTAPARSKNRSPILE